MKREGGTERDQGPGVLNYGECPGPPHPLAGKAGGGRARPNSEPSSGGTRCNRLLLDLDALGFPPDARLGLAVSGGADSLALLLLAARALPGRIEAATVDHGFRPEARREAAGVATICHSLGVPHATLSPSRASPEELVREATVPAPRMAPAQVLRDAAPPNGSLQMRARMLRYRLLLRWAREQGLDWLATAHHQDDQAETLLLRIARGSGVGGLGGVRPCRAIAGINLVRPLLGWPKRELGGVVATAGIDPVDDPANCDERHDRTRVRRLLAQTDWLDPARLGRVAANMRDADDALGWIADRLWDERVTTNGDHLTMAVQDLPRELKRRLLILAIEQLSPVKPATVRLDRLARLLVRLEAGETGTIGFIKVRPGDGWQVSVAPPRRTWLARVDGRGLPVTCQLEPVAAKLP